MEFYDTIKDLDWDDVTRSVYAKTDRDVRNALSKEMLTLEDFKALISPAAEPYLETMASMSRALTQKRFGKVNVFIQGRDLLDNTLEREYTSLDFNETWVESIRNNRRLLMLGMNYGL